MVTLHFVTIAALDARLIQWFTWCNYSHVDLVMPRAGGGEDWIGARSDGVKVRAPYPVTRRAVFQVDAPATVYDFALSQVGKPYDFTAIFSLVLRRQLERGQGWRMDDAWFCSELAAWCFEKAGVPLLRADHVNRLTPRDLMLSPLLKPITL